MFGLIKGMLGTVRNDSKETYNSQQNFQHIYIAILIILQYYNKIFQFGIKKYNFPNESSLKNNFN